MTDRSTLRSTLHARWLAVRGTPEGILAWRLALVLAVYAVVRLVFLIAHRAQFAESSAADIFGAFLHGIRFDLSAIVYSNLPFILLSLAPVSWLATRSYQRALMALFVIVNGALAIIMIGDVGYYPYTGTRVTMDVFALTGEATAQLDQLLVNYAGLFAVAILLAASLGVFYPRWRARSMPTPTPTPPEAPRRDVGRGFAWARRALGILGVLAVAVLAARGGFQKKPLNPIHAFASGQHEIGVLTLNTAFTLIHSAQDRQLEPVRYFDDERELEALISAPYGLPAALPAGARRQNVLMLVLESFGNEYWGGTDRDAPMLTPFLDSLAQHGTFFTNSFANGRRSMDALPSLLVGVPLYLGKSIAVSAYQSNQWLGLGHFLNDEGFHTSMFHGAVKGTMYFDAIAAMAGITDFYPLERFPPAVRGEDYDGDWGLFDEPALQFTATELSKHQEPWFSLAFTISTHHPFTVPERYRDSLPKGTEPIHQSVAYVDLAVRRFFETARTQPWFENTLFIITGDHTPPVRSRRFDTALGRYMVPTLLYHPTQQLPDVAPDRVMQHVDIFTTILDYSGARPARIPAFGRSLFADVPGEAVLTTDEIFWLVREEGVLERLPSGAERVLAYDDERTGEQTATLPEPMAAEMSRRLQAYLQHYVMSMINNSFYREPAERSLLRAAP